MIKRHSKSSRRAAEKKADEALSRYIRSVYPACVMCGSTKNLTAGHYITRNSKSVRYDLLNVFGQCRRCNFLHEHYPERMTAWYLRTYGLKTWEDLVARAAKTKKWTVPELEKLAEEFDAMRRAGAVMLAAAKSARGMRMADPSFGVRTVKHS